MFRILILILTISPTLLDRTDYDPWHVFPPRYITQERLLDRGFVEGTLTIAQGHYPEVGLIDNNTSEYVTYEDGAGSYFVTPWRITAAVTPTHGLVIFENNTLLYSQDEPYEQFTATVRIERERDTLIYYLNGVKMFTSDHELESKDLRGYFYDAVILHRMGTPRPSLQKPTKGRTHVSN
jgi:hypothetical protein